MFPKELSSYIRGALAQGFTREQIRQALEAAGWQATQVSEGLNEVDAPAVVLSTSASQFTWSPRLTRICIAVGVILLCAGGAWFAWSRFGSSDAIKKVDSTSIAQKSGNEPDAEKGNVTGFSFVTAMTELVKREGIDSGVDEVCKGNVLHRFFDETYNPRDYEQIGKKFSTCIASLGMAENATTPDDFSIAYDAKASRQIELQACVIGTDDPQKIFESQKQKYLDLYNDCINHATQSMQAPQVNDKPVSREEALYDCKKVSDLGAFIFYSDCREDMGNNTVSSAGCFDLEKARAIYHLDISPKAAAIVTQERELRVALFEKQNMQECLKNYHYFSDEFNQWQRANFGSDW